MRAASPLSWCGPSASPHWTGVSVACLDPGGENSAQRFQSKRWFRGKPDCCRFGRPQSILSSPDLALETATCRLGCRISQRSATLEVRHDHNWWDSQNGRVFIRDHRGPTRWCGSGSIFWCHSADYSNKGSPWNLAVTFKSTRSCSYKDIESCAWQSDILIYLFSWLTMIQSQSLDAPPARQSQLIRAACLKLQDYRLKLHSLGSSCAFYWPRLVWRRGTRTAGSS